MVHGHVVVVGEVVHRLFRYLHVDVVVPGHNLAVPVPAE